MPFSQKKPQVFFTDLSDNARNLCLLPACLYPHLNGILGQLISHDYLKNWALCQINILQVSFLIPTKCSDWRYLDKIF